MSNNINDNQQLATLTFTLKKRIGIDAYYKLLGITPPTNNYLKMHGGVMRRKGRFRR